MSCVMHLFGRGGPGPGGGDGDGDGDGGGGDGGVGFGCGGSTWGPSLVRFGNGRPVATCNRQQPTHRHTR